MILFNQLSFKKAKKEVDFKLSTSFLICLLCKINIKMSIYKQLMSN